jgi:hypothetical protein
MRRAANWRQILVGGVLAVLVVGITLGGFWSLTPSREEILMLRAERAQLQSAIDPVVVRGGKADQGVLRRVTEADLRTSHQGHRQMRTRFIHGIFCGFVRPLIS